MTLEFRLAALLFAGLFASTVLAQQDQGPILLPKPKPKPAPTATLLVVCDLACNWKLDTAPMGHIDPGGSARAPVSLGEHIVVATTDDGLDAVQQIPSLEVAGQKIVNLELKPIREARRTAEQAAHDIWTDPSTGLAWTARDNGRYLTWQEAEDYCTTLRLDGISGWKLPRIGELATLYDSSLSSIGTSYAPVYVVRGHINLSGVWLWSSTTGDDSDHALAWSVQTGARASYRRSYATSARVLCVRAQGE